MFSSVPYFRVFVCGEGKQKITVKTEKKKFKYILFTCTKIFQYFFHNELSGKGKGGGKIHYVLTTFENYRPP